MGYSYNYTVIDRFSYIICALEVEFLVYIRILLCDKVKKYSFSVTL